MKGIALIRVSTDSQDLKQQSEVVINEMIRDGYTNDNIILIEDKESGVLLSEEERQGLTKMKSYIESDNEINAVYVFELSRLSRKPEVLYSIRNYLVEHKIQLVVLKPSIKLFEDGRINETANMMFAIFAGMAEQEGYLRKERMSRGKRKTVREGKWTGGRLLLGYTVDSNNTLIIDEPNAIIVRNIFNYMIIYKVNGFQFIVGPGGQTFGGLVADDIRPLGSVGVVLHGLEGCGGTLGTNPETGRPMLIIDPENGRIRDRNNDKARAEHLNEIIQTRIGFFQRQGEIQDDLKKYRELKFPTFKIER